MNWQYTEVIDSGQNHLTKNTSNSKLNWIVY